MKNWTINNATITANKSRSTIWNIKTRIVNVSSITQCTRKTQEKTRLVNYTLVNNDY